MIGIFILIGAYRYYAELAKQYGRVAWQYGILGLVVYLGTQVLYGFVYGIYLAINDPYSLEQRSYTSFSGVNMIGWLISIVAVCGVYFLIKANFERSKRNQPTSNIDEIGKEEQ